LPTRVGTPLLAAAWFALFSCSSSSSVSPSFSRCLLDDEDDDDNDDGRAVGQEPALEAMLCRLAARGAAI
jgi:hypothetical protein